MKVLTALECLERLVGCKPGSQVFVSYLAGREPSQKALAQCPKDMNGRHLVGTLSEVRIAKNGDPIITLFVHNRGHEGAYRAINPNLGRVLDIQLLT